MKVLELVSYHGESNCYTTEQLKVLQKKGTLLTFPIPFANAEQTNHKRATDCNLRENHIVFHVFPDK